MVTWKQGGCKNRLNHLSRRHKKTDKSFDWKMIFPERVNVCDENCSPNVLTLLYRHTLLYNTPIKFYFNNLFFFKSLTVLSHTLFSYCMTTT